MNNSSIEHFFDAYKAAFEAYDLDKLIALFNTPFFLVHLDIPLTLDNRGILNDKLRSLLDAYKEMGLHQVKYKILGTHRVSKGIVSVEIDWIISNIKDEVISHFQCIYHLLSVAGEYKIMICINPLEQFNKN